MNWYQFLKLSAKALKLPEEVQNILNKNLEKWTKEVIDIIKNGDESGRLIDQFSFTHPYDGRIVYVNLLAIENINHNMFNELGEMPHAWYEYKDPASIRKNPEDFSASEILFEESPIEYEEEKEQYIDIGLNIPDLRRSYQNAKRSMSIRVNKKKEFTKEEIENKIKNYIKKNINDLITHELIHAIDPRLSKYEIIKRKREENKEKYVNPKKDFKSYIQSIEEFNAMLAPIINKLHELVEKSIEEDGIEKTIEKLKTTLEAFSQYSYNSENLFDIGLGEPKTKSIKSRIIENPSFIASLEDPYIRKIFLQKMYNEITSLIDQLKSNLG